MARHHWTSLTDDQLLRQCDVDTYRASGPGGQKRNKTSSAVRLRHLPSGLLVIAEESRSQHENKARALRRMRQALYLKLREPVPRTSEVATLPDYASARDAEGRLHLGRKDPRFWPASDDDLVGLRQQGFQVLLSLTEDRPRRDWIEEAGLLVFHEPMEDMAPPSQEQLDRAVSAIRKATEREMAVAVHCGAGLGRT